MKIQSATFIKSAVQPGEYPQHYGREFAFAGRSNVGKSSLLNCLVRKRALAKTSNTPGRTRLINFFLVNEEFVLVDLPGYGFARVSAQMQKEWGEMMEAYLTQRTNLVAVVLILDIRRDFVDDDASFIAWLRERGLRVLLVANKVDKLSMNQRLGRLTLLRRAYPTSIDGGIIPFSSKTGEGRAELWQALTALTER